MTSRRELLKWTMAMMAMPAAARAATDAAGHSVDPGRAAKPLDILILGGTGFLGPHQVDYALARGHRVTLFNRGKRAKGLHDDRVEVLIGDRDTKIAPGLEALQGTRRWDIVIDNSGYVPRQVRDSVELLKDRVGRYVYVSTVSVYDPAGGPVFDETSPLHPAPGAETEKVTAETYGPLKAECDRIVQAEFGARATIVRPNYIFGPGDVTYRFPYWVQRVARGGDVLGPPDPKVELQWVDVRDLCPWTVQLGERDQPGVFNASGPVIPVNWQQVLQSLSSLSDKPVRIRWATPEVLKETDISLPLVDSGPEIVSEHFDGRKATGVGLHYRPLADTASATLAWWRGLTPEQQAEAKRWPTPEKEQQALALLKAP